MLNQRQMRAYRRFRSEGCSANQALKIVKAQETKHVEWSFGETFQRDGFDIIVTYEPDDSADYSHLGEFTSRADSTHSMGEFLLVPGSRLDRNKYRFFRLENTVPDVAHDLIKLKYGKRQAWETAWKQAKEDMREAIDYACIVVFVRVKKNGIELGTDVLGGIDGDCETDYIEAVESNDMIDNAIAEAKRNLSVLCG
jgi:hypothetical protein